MTEAEKITAEAWAAFEKWIEKNDPEGELDILQQIQAYSAWCDKGNRVEL